jgi:resuscitation-promoting factor RpfB
MLKILTGAMLSLALLAGGTANAAAYTDSQPLPVSPSATSLSATQVAPAVKKVSFKAGAHKAKIIKTKAVTVADLLVERHVHLGATDVVSPAATTALTNRAKVVVTRVKVVTATVTEVIAAPVVKQLNAKLKRSVTKVLVAGAAGSAQRTFTTTTVNGKVVNKTLLAETILLAPVTRVVEVGTKGKPLNLAHLKLWNKIARCESGGNWHINTGNGYYGGLQFALGTWRAFGGRDFASKPHKASKAEQITVANRLYAKRGTRPWGCA